MNEQQEQNMMNKWIITEVEYGGGRLAFQVSNAIHTLPAITNYDGALELRDYFNALEARAAEWEKAVVYHEEVIARVQKQRDELEARAALADEIKPFFVNELIPRYAELVEALLGRGEDEHWPSVIGEIVADWLARYNALEPQHAS